MYQDWFEEFEKVKEEGKKKMCKCCEEIEELQELQKNQEKIPGIKDILKVRLTMVTRKKGIKKDKGTINYKAFDLNYCPMCGRRLEE